MKPDASTGLYTLVFLDKKGKRLYWTSSISYLKPNSIEGISGPMRSSNSSAPRVRTGCWSRGVRRRTLSWWASDSKWKLFRLWMELKEMKTSHSWRWLQAARSNSDLSLCIFYEGVFSIFSKRVCFFLEIINNLILDGKFYYWEGSTFIPWLGCTIWDICNILRKMIDFQCMSCVIPLPWTDYLQLCISSAIFSCSALQHASLRF